jgi:hypothetical protein
MGTNRGSTRLCGPPHAARIKSLRLLHEDSGICIDTDFLAILPPVADNSHPDVFKESRSGFSASSRWRSFSMLHECFHR